MTGDERPLPGRKLSGGGEGKRCGGTGGQRQAGLGAGVKRARTRKKRKKKEKTGRKSLRVNRNMKILKYGLEIWVSTAELGIYRFF